jgi:hypothetical protein
MHDVNSLTGWVIHPFPIVLVILGTYIWGLKHQWLKTGWKVIHRGGGRCLYSEGQRSNLLNIKEVSRVLKEIYCNPGLFEEG